jgi:STE24 endopeptidase
VFDPGELERARRHQRPLRRLRVVRLVSGLAVTVAFVVLEAGPRLTDALASSGWVVQLLVVLLALELAHLVVDVPLDAWVDLRHERRWGLSTQTARGLAVDEATSAVLSLVIGAALLVPVYTLVRATPWWWLWAWLLVLAAGLVAGLLFPVVVAPLFNRFEPLEEGALRQRVQAVAEGAGVRVARVEVADESRRSRRDNAYVAGLGPTRRIVLYDSLLTTPPEMVEQVVAHELGHVRRHHLLRQLPVVGVVALAALAGLGALSRWAALFEAFGIAGPGDPAGLGLALLGVQVVGAVAAPVTAWTSRAHEREADLEALTLLGRPDLAEDMLRRLHVANLADLEPSRLSRLLASHPPAAERIAFARRWATATTRPA